MHALLRLELQRQRPMAVRMALLTVIVVGVFFAAGKRAPAELLAAVLGSGLGALLIVPMGVSRDKMEGTLDFICGLPVEPRAIAMSRLMAMAILAAPWAIAAGVTAAMLPAATRVDPVAVCVFAWIVALIIGACGVAALTCFELETMLGAPMVVLVITFAVAPRIVRALFPRATSDAALQVLRQPAAPLLVALSLAVAAGVVCTIAYWAIVRALSRYRADPVRR